VGHAMQYDATHARWWMMHKRIVHLLYGLVLIYRIEAGDEHLLAVVLCFGRGHRVEIEGGLVLTFYSPVSAVTLAGVGLCFVAEVSRSWE
jgi:hypothetical protein